MIETLDIILPDGEGWRWSVTDAKPEFKYERNGVKTITKGAWPGVFGIKDWDGHEWEVRGEIYMLRYKER